MIEAQSNLSYEPPVSEASPQEQVDFADALKGVIGEIQDEYNPEPEFTDEELDAEADDVGQTGQTPEIKVPVKPEAEDAEEPSDPAVARGLDRLVAREAAFA